MLRLTNTDLPMIADRLYGSVCSTQAPYASHKQNINDNQAWQHKLIHANDENAILQLLNPNGNSQHHQHSIDSYLLQVYIHEQYLPAFSSLAFLINSALTLSFDTPSGSTYHHLYITAIRQLDHDGSYGYYRLLAQPITYQLHQHPRSHVDIDLSVIAMTADRTSTLAIEVTDDSGNSWTPARITQWQLSDWAHICERLSRQGLTGYLRHSQTEEHTPPTLVITQAYPSDEDGISNNIGAIRFTQVLHDRRDAPVLAITKRVIAIPTSVTIQRFNSASVSHPTQSADTNANSSDGNANNNNNTNTSSTITLDSPAAFAPVTDTEAVDEALILAQSYQSKRVTYSAIAHANNLSVADTFMLTGHVVLDAHYRTTHIVHLARNSLAHVTGLTVSSRHRERHASNLEAGSHLTQLRLIHADTPWVGSQYSRQSLPPMTGITEEQSDTDSRNHMTPTKLYVLDAPAQAINKLEAQAGANYGSHFTHRAGDQTLVQSIGDSEHLINTGSLLSNTRPSLFTTQDEQAVESGYRNTDNGLSEWVTDHRDTKAYSQLQVKDGQVAANLKMGIINSVSSDDVSTESGGSKREGISATTDKQVSIKTGEALILSTQPQTHAQASEHDYQHHTPTLTQTSLGGQHLTERLTQLATGLGRNPKDHKAIKTQLEAIAKEQETATHHTTPFTLIDGAADISYTSQDTLVHRTMGELLTSTQQDRHISSGDSHQQISSESLNIIADGQVSLTNAKENLTLSAHTGKLEATAKQDINIASSSKEVEIVATNRITLTAGGASITLDGADITIAGKQFTEKAGKHTRAGGGRDGFSLAGLPNIIPDKKTLMDGVYNLAYQFVDDDEEPYANTPYTAINKVTGEEFKGITDKDGWSERFQSNSEDDIEVVLKLDWQSDNERSK